MPTNGKLAGKLAVVIGGGTGIGFSIAQRFAQENAKVVLVGRREKILKEAVEHIGLGATFEVCDIANENEVEALFKKLDRVNILANLAGKIVLGPIDKVPIKELKETFEGRFWGQLMCVKYATKKMTEGDSIILCSGIAGDFGIVNYIGGGAIAGGIDAMGRTLAVELGARGIRVNVLKPGLIAGTDLQRSDFTDSSEEYWYKWYNSVLASLPLKRPGVAEDCVECAMFFATSHYVTGISVPVDGGWLAGMRHVQD